MSNKVNLGGSIKNKITNTDLLEERAKRTFPKEELYEFLVDEKMRTFSDKFSKVIADYPELMSDFKYYDMTREEKMEMWWKKINILRNSKYGKEYFEDGDSESYGNWTIFFPGVSPATVHTSMFFKSIEFLASEE